MPQLKDPKDYQHSRGKNVGYYVSEETADRMARVKARWKLSYGKTLERLLDCEAELRRLQRRGGK